MSRPQMISRKNRSYDAGDERPEELEWFNCKVCGYPLNGSRTGEPENFSGIVQIVTGETWLLDTAHPGVDGLHLKTKQVEPRVVSGCPHCGSGNWMAARGLEGLAPVI